MLTAPNWFARTRRFSIMLYPEALVDGGQFSVWASAWKYVVG